MRLLLIFGSIFILSIHAAAQPEIFTVEYAKVAGNTLSLCGIEETVKPDGDKKSATAELTIENEENGVVEVKNLKGTFSDDSSSIEFTYDANDGLNGNTYAIYTKVTVTTITDPLKETTATEYEFSGTFTFTETTTENYGIIFYSGVQIIQITGGSVPAFKVTDGTQQNIIIEQSTIDCNDANTLCAKKVNKDIAETHQVEIYNGLGDTIPISTADSGKIVAGNLKTCDGDLQIIVVYDNTAEVNPKGYTFSATEIEKFYAVTNNVNFKLNELIEIQSQQEFNVIQYTTNACEKIPAPVRDMKFLKPFDHTVEISWDVDAKNDNDPPSNEFYLEVSDNNQKTVIKKLHIDCSQDGLTTCIAYVFDDKVLNADITLNYELSKFNNPGAGKSKTKETSEYVQTRQTDDEKSLKALNLNQFEINWNTNQGKLCVEDSLFKETKISQYRYELVIGFAVGKWKKHIADYIDESTICFNDFEITQLIENKLGVHFLVMKRESDTNQIVASDMITTDLIVPEISEVNDETISLEFENLNSPFLIRDEKTKNIISKNEKKIHNLAFLKSSHENKSIFNKNLVLETRKEHTQMRVHFKIPQKVNAA